MKNYNYLEAMIEDVKEYVGDNFTAEEIAEKLEDRSEWESELYDALWIEDSVTGNASGSYTFNTYRAEECIAHNLDLLSEAIKEFGCDADILEKGAEWCDVTIRCYLLGQAISEALDELESETEAA